MSRLVSQEDQDEIVAVLALALPKWRYQAVRWTGESFCVVCDGAEFDLESAEFHAMGLTRHLVVAIGDYLRENKALPWEKKT